MDVNGTIKCVTLPAALIGTIQAAVCFILSIITILFYNDVIEISSDISRNSYGYIIYYLYLRSGDTSFDFIINSKIFNIIMYVYTVLNFIWLLISICMLWVAIRRKWNNVSKIVICWSTITICIALIDISFMGVLASDFKTAHDVLEPTTTSSDMTLYVEQDIYTTIAIVMTLAARGYVLWIVNVVFAVVLAVALAKSRTKTRSPAMQMPIIDAYQNGTRAFSMYDEVEIDKAFQNEAFESEEPNIFSPRPFSYSNNNNINRNPLSNGHALGNSQSLGNINRSSEAYVPHASNSYDPNKPVRIPLTPYNGKLAKIGKPGGRKTPPQQISSPIVPYSFGMPYIPEPDYSPIGSPELKPRGVLRPSSKYEH